MIVDLSRRDAVGFTELVECLSQCYIISQRKGVICLLYLHHSRSVIAGVIEENCPSSFYKWNIELDDSFYKISNFMEVEFHLYVQLQTLVSMISVNEEAIDAMS